MTKHTKKQLIIGAVLLILYFVLLWAIVWKLFTPSTTPDPSPTPSVNIGQEVTKTGALTCLSHKDTSGPQTMECAIGLKTDDGQYYALLDESTDVASTPFDRRVRVSGVLVSPQSTIYLIDGTIKVNSIVKI